MSSCWSIDRPSSRVRVVKLTAAALDQAPVVVAEELSIAIGETFYDDDTNATIELDFTDWNAVDSRLLALLLYFQRRCRERNYKLVTSSPPRLLSEMASRLGVSQELGIGVSRSRDYSQLFQAESQTS